MTMWEGGEVILNDKGGLGAAKGLFFFLQILASLFLYYFKIGGKGEGKGDSQKVILHDEGGSRPPPPPP